MSTASTTPPVLTPGVKELQSSLQRLERRDWWMWGTAIVVMLLLSGVVITFSFPGLWKQDEFQTQLEVAVRGLLGIVLLFSTSTVYQQVMIRRLRMRLTRELTCKAALEERAETLEKLAILDPLTGLYNRRFVNDHLPLETARAQRQAYPLTVLVMDLNRFKQINDLYGHAAGDLVLREFAARMRKAFRSSDVLVRMGGDEFLVVLPECSAAAVPAALARMGELEITYGGQRIAFGAAAGWAEYRVGESLQSLLERADHALYRDKQTGTAKAQARDADARLRHAQKLQTIEQITGSVANDFCNVVEVIQAHARNLSDRVGADGGLRDVQQIQAATVRAAALVTRLLAFTRHEPLRPGTLIDLNLILDQLRPLLEALLTEKIHMVIDQGSKLGLLRGDASQIEQVIMNLALSACETLDAGGQLTISTANACLNDDFARQNPGVRSGPYVRLSVAAKRLGPTSETSATPFLPSFHTDPQPERGMGLAMVSGIVKQMAGYIAIESQPGKASRFDLYWPEDLASRESSCFCPETAGKADEQAERTALTIMGSCSG